VCERDLLGLVERGFDLTANIREDLLQGLESTELRWYVYFDVFYGALDSMQSVVLLLKSQKYRECITVLRTIFEHYFLLVLMMNGLIYRETRRYRVGPGLNMARRDARDATLDKWRKDWESKKPGYEDIVDIQQGGPDDAIDVTIETKGLYERGDVEKTGQIVPRFYFVYDQYDPDVHYLSDLGTLYRSRTTPKELVEIHKRLYGQFLNIRRICRNLRLNKLLTREEEDRFWVHYNFLSCYAHPTRKGLIDPENIIPSWPRRIRYDRAFELLVLGYLAQFQSMYLVLMVSFFEEVNPKSELEKYKNHVMRLESASSYFWFIYNNPSQSDIARAR